MKFNYYSPKQDHPEWGMVRDHAVRQANEILPLIHTDADDTIGDKVADGVRLARAMSTALKNFWINRKRWKNDDHAFRPLYFIWSMINSCNFRCTYCEDNRGNAYPSLPDNPLDLENRIKLLKVMRTGTSAIYFCGGEPTLVEDLPLYTDVAYHLGYRPLMINTNGFNLHVALKRPSWRKWLRQMDLVIVSLDTLNIERLKSMWGVKRVEQVLKNLLMLRELKQHVDFKLMINAVILEDTVEEVSDLLDFINDLGDVWFVAVPAGFNGSKEKATFASGSAIVNRDDYQLLAEKIRRRKKQGQLVVGSERILSMFQQGTLSNCLPTLRPQVDPDGRMAWPCRAAKNVAPVYLNLLDYKSLDDAWSAGRDYISATNFYGDGPDQCGEVCMYMKTHTTTRYFEAIEAPIRSGILSEIREFVFSNL